MLNLLDLIILVILGLFLVRGLMRGFLGEAASLVGVVLGVMAAYTYQPFFSGVASSLGVGRSPISSLVVFFLIFLTVLVGVRFLAWLLGKAFKGPVLGTSNRLMGAGLAFLKAVVIIYVGIVLLSFVLPGNSTILKDSKLAPFVVRTFKDLSGVISPKHYEEWKERFLNGTKGKDKTDKWSKVIS